MARAGLMAPAVGAAGLAHPRWVVGAAVGRPDRMPRRAVAGPAGPPQAAWGRAPVAPHGVDGGRCTGSAWPLPPVPRAAVLGRAPPWATQGRSMGEMGELGLRTQALDDAIVSWGLKMDAITLNGGHNSSIYSCMVVWVSTLLSYTGICLMFHRASRCIALLSSLLGGRVHRVHREEHVPVY